MCSQRRVQTCTARGGGNGVLKHTLRGLLVAEEWWGEPHPTEGELSIGGLGLWFGRLGEGFARNVGPFADGGDGVEDLFFENWPGGISALAFALAGEQGQQG